VGVGWLKWVAHGGWLERGPQVNVNVNVTAIAMAIPIATATVNSGESRHAAS